MRTHDDINVSSVQLRWSPNTFRGFGASILVFSAVVLVSMCTRIEPPKPYPVPPSPGMIEVRFGDGDGTGGRRGNLTREGAAARGPEGNPLDDAAQSRQSRKATSTDDPTLYAQHRLVSETGNNGKSREQADANDNRGLKDGSDDGSGLGWVGTGKGKGLGIDNVDWGGGGNRTVLKKEMPKFPTGTLNTEVKLKFRVRPDGTVSWVMPVRRGGNPQVDQAAMSALYRWRFNPLSTNVEMEGTITFVFRNS